jgi:hypothetical protein
MVVCDQMPYLSDMLRSIVAEVNTVLDFEVFFKHGHQTDIGKELYKDGALYPLIWLPANSVTWSRPAAARNGINSGLFGDVSFDLLLAMPTDNAYTAEERETNIFKPILHPVYLELIRRIGKSNFFNISSSEEIKHSAKDWHYWGGNEMNNNAKNLWDDFIDAVHLKSITLPVRTVKL